MRTLKCIIQTLRAFRLPSSQAKCEDISENRIAGDAVACQGLAGVQEVPKSSRRPQDGVSYVFLRVGEAEEADSCVSGQRFICVLACRKGQGDRFIRVFTCRRGPRGFGRSSRRPQDGVSYVFLRVGEAPEAELYVFSRAGEAQRAWQELGRVWQGCRWSPGSPKRPQEGPGSRFIRVFTCLSGGARGLRVTSTVRQGV